MQEHETDIPVPFRETRPRFDRPLVPFKAAFHVAPSQAQGTELDIALRESRAAVDRRHQLFFGFFVFLYAHERHPEIVMGRSTLWVSGNRLALLGNIFLGILGFVHFNSSP